MPLIILRIMLLLASGNWRIIETEVISNKKNQLSIDCKEKMGEGVD
jgi:hypothetical protein